MRGPTSSRHKPCVQDSLLSGGSSVISAQTCSSSPRPQWRWSSPGQATHQPPWRAASRRVQSAPFPCGRARCLQKSGRIYLSGTRYEKPCLNSSWKRDAKQDCNYECTSLGPPLSPGCGLLRQPSSGTAATQGFPPRGTSDTNRGVLPNATTRNKVYWPTPPGSFYFESKE